MYGSIHNHFESRYDTANGDFKTMLRSYDALQAKKVVISDHGVFSAYEDAQDALRHLQKEQGECLDIELIPGIEGYANLSDSQQKESSHLLLFAKDYMGYQSLCKIITQSNLDYQDGKPIITLENLKQNVAKGHLVCTTACIAGPFGVRFGLERIALEEKLERQLQTVSEQPLDVALLFTKEELQEKAFTPLRNINYAPKDKPVTLIRDLLKQNPKTEAEHYLYRYAITKANVAILETLRKERKPKGSKDHPVNALALQYHEQRKTSYERLQATYEEKKPKAISFQTLQGIIDRLGELPTQEETLQECNVIYQNLQSIFGMDDFYFELQYHGLEKEALIYPQIVEFATSLGNTNHFILSNDVHIGISKRLTNTEVRNSQFVIRNEQQDGDESWEEMLQREVQKRDIIRFSRYNKFFHDDDTIFADDYEYYIKDDEELVDWVSKIIPDEAILANGLANIETVLSACHVEFPKEENHYPAFCEDPEAQLDLEIQKGMALRFPNGFPTTEEFTPSDYEERLSYELDIIKRMGYASYHLIVADYLTFCRKLGFLPDELMQSEDGPMTMEEVDRYLAEHQIEYLAYSIGPGRGSAVGSLVCYILGISDVDPLPYHLLFERFLNPERTSMPDIDSDFRTDVRAKGIDYCKRKYGYDNVCNILTKSYAATKGAIRLTTRYMGTKAYLHDENEKKGKIADYLKPFYQLADKLCAEYDAYEKLGLSLPFYDYYKGTRQERQVLQLASSIEGCFTNYGQHAAGTIISGDCISDTIPLMFSEKKENLETQCNMGQAEAKGYLKMDFLGLNNLDIITSIMRKTKDGRILDYAEREKILNDPRIYAEIYSKGLTQGVFQTESMGMKSTMQRFQPENIEDVILLIAVYRPGPMQFIPELIAEKWYQKAKKNGGQVLSNGSILWNGAEYAKPVHSINIDNDSLSAILAPTYGCIIYQEQIMQICQTIAGFTMGHADDVRRYMSKKKEQKLAAERPDFVNGCMNSSNLSKFDAESLFDKMIDFAKYAFNKSHATAYSVVSIFTAYFKLYHPGVFFAESLNAVQNLDAVLDFTIELPTFGLELLPPDLQRSEDIFVCVGNRLYYGLSFIKGLSEIDYVKTRTFLDFILLNRERITEKTMEKLAKCGLFDSMEPSITRMDLVLAIPAIYKALNVVDKAREKERICFEQVEYLQPYEEKTRLKLEEKIELCQYLKLRKAPEKLTVKEVSKKIEALRTKALQQNYIVAEEEDKVENILRVLRLTSKHTTESILFNRKNEWDLLGYVFDINKSLTVLDACNTFPAGTVDCRNRVEQDIPNLGLIVLNPCVKRTPGGWTKVLCCDKNRTYKNIYFNDAFPQDITEFAITFREEKMQEERKSKDGKTNSNNMYIAPHAYGLNELGFCPSRHVYLQYQADWEEVVRALCLDGRPFYPTAYLHCGELDNFHIPCKEEYLMPLLRERKLFYVDFKE